MKILVADFLFVDVHKDMNLNFISAVSRFAETDVLSLNGYYDNQREAFYKNKVRLLDVNAERKSGALGARSFSLELMKKTAEAVQKKNYDAVLCLGFETTLFGLGLSKFKGLPVFIFHHKNIDELTSSTKRFAFGCYKNRVYHVVFEEFFRNRLVNEIGVRTEKVFVVPHPVKAIEGVPTEKRYDCVGLCNSNDEDFIKEAVNKECDFREYGLHILLRSKVHEKKDGPVEVIRGFMEKEIYDELMAAGKTVFVPLPETYIYRLSGSIYDALSRRKLVYTTSKYYAQEYERRYPGTCKHVGSVDELIERLQEKRDSGASASFQQFIDGHSIETVSNDIKQMVSTVLKETNT